MDLQSTISGTKFHCFEDKTAYDCVFPFLTGPDRDKENMDAVEPEL